MVLTVVQTLHRHLQTQEEKQREKGHVRHRLCQLAPPGHGWPAVLTSCTTTAHQFTRSVHKEGCELDTLKR